MAKSIGTILGEIYLAFKKGEINTSSIDTSQLGMSPEAFVGQSVGEWSAEKFIAFINSFTPATDEQRKAKADALQAIQDEGKLFKKFRSDFAAAIQEDEPAEETTTKIAAGTGPNLSSPVTVEQSSTIARDVAETTRQRRVGQTPVGQTQSELDTELFEKYSALGLIGNEAATLSYIQSVGANNIDAEELEFLYAAASDAPLRPKKLPNGKTQLVPFPGHFQGIPLSDIIDSYASPDEIKAFQNFMEQNNIVPQNYFASSRGQYSEELRKSIQVVMNWIDKNIYAEEGTSLHTEILNNTQSSPIFFTQTQQLNGSFSYARQLFNYGLQEMAVNAQQYELAQEAEYAKELAQQYIPPSQETLDDMVEGYFEAKLGRKPTEGELDEWSTKLAASHSTSFQIARAKAEELQSYNFMRMQPEYSDITVGDQTYSGVGKVDLSMFSIPTPEEITQSQFEQEYSKGIEARKNGREIRKMQQDLLIHVLGG